MSSYQKCKDCTKRTLGCHSTCEDYLAFRKERDEALRRMRVDSYFHEKTRREVTRW